MYVIWSLGLGGAERVVLNLAKGLDKTKFEPVICCLNWPGEFAAEAEAAGIEVIALGKKPGVDFGIIGRLVAAMCSRQADIVHTHLWTANFWGRIAAVRAGVPVIIASEHGISTRRGAFKFLADRILSLFSDRVTFVAENVKRQFARKTVYNQRKAIVVYNALPPESADVTRGERIKQEFGIQAGESVISCIGRLSPEKGHQYLFEALTQFDSSYKYKVLIVGDGKLLESLQSSVVSRPCLPAGRSLQGKIVFTGLRKDVPNILAATDICVIPSTREAHSMVALEAMAAGVPVIASDVGGMSEIIADDVTGFLVPAGDAAALALKIQILLEDDQRRRQFSRQGLTVVRERFGVVSMIRASEKLYREAYERTCRKKR